MSVTLHVITIKCQTRKGSVFFLLIQIFQHHFMLKINTITQLHSREIYDSAYMPAQTPATGRGSPGVWEFR